MIDFDDNRALLRRRKSVLSPGYFHHYDDPLHAVRAKGVTIWDQSGRAYLDCYNNVPSVGHSHPHVLEALARQASQINTHSRYLHNCIVEYAERLLETLPPHIDTCVFVCSGTEANALAYDIARTVTKRSGVVVTEGAYHGNALSVADFSLYRTPATKQPDFVISIPVPCSPGTSDAFDQSDPGYAAADIATQRIGEMAVSKNGLAMLIIDTIFDAPGIHTAPPGYLARLTDVTRQAGGLVVMDEVQAGLTRLGDNMWGFEDSGIVPDLVTMGKPMGAGYPLAAVVGNRSVFEAFSKERHYFNTFGGTPVAGAVGNAVLDVITGENILMNVKNVGRYLRAGLERLKEQFSFTRAIRGKGLFLGIEMIKVGPDCNGGAATAHSIVNELRRNGVLISACGPSGNVLKIRPPLVFSQNNADQLLESLQTAFEIETLQWPKGRTSYE